ncbi:hypothetical protein IGI04_040586 [Brassica rapa subsp. trilocularis]|uniref:Uncharacterized protein n=1 Tax=Brassica rapa subsp. trilocularis TaxID=1813537 RepID=A0ABQ7KN92_BRACM|nr:hypothetical protein IGI04_039511 [Brassica rapa subsp. trilocularis]KAG5375990.1 hypothetical protein IGI04_040586 [Brassica rapa subsp. trilocularis]
MNEDKCITAIILSMLTTEVERVAVNVVKSVTLAENTAAKFASFDTTVMVSIQNLLNNFKEEVIHSVMQINSSANTTTQPTRPNVDTTNNAQRKLDIVQPQRDSNDEIIAQVTGNLSQYTVLPHNASVCPGLDGRIGHTTSRLPFVLQTQDPSFDDAHLSANSHTKEATKAQAGQIFHNSSRQPFGSQTEVPYLDCTTLSANSQTHTKDGSKMTVWSIFFPWTDISSESPSSGAHV